MLDQQNPTAQPLHPRAWPLPLDPPLDPYPPVHFGNVRGGLAEESSPLADEIVRRPARVAPVANHRETEQALRLRRAILWFDRIQPPNGGRRLAQLRKWEKSGEMLPARKTRGGARDHGMSDFLGVPNEASLTFCYARVSSHDQKDDLKR